MPNDGVDGWARHVMVLAPPTLPNANVGGAFAPAAALAAQSHASLEHLLPALVRRIAWVGDRKRGSIRIELGAGRYAGATLVVHADDGRVRVEVGGAPGADVARLRARLDERLRDKGFDVDSVT